MDHNSDPPLKDEQISESTASELALRGRPNPDGQLTEQVGTDEKTSQSHNVTPSDQSEHREIPSQPDALYNQGTELIKRFKQSGQHEDLEMVISFYRQALKLQPAPHPHRSRSLNNLANALRIRFDQSGQQKELDEVISCYREALDLRPAQQLRESLLSNLASALTEGFGQFGRQGDLEAAISSHREVLGLRPAHHPRRGTALNDLGTMLMRRFEQFSQQEDLEAGISYLQEALELRPAPHPERSMSLCNLGTALVTRFEQSSQHNDLCAAILFHQEALKLQPVPHAGRSMSLSSLGRALSIRFEQSSQPEDLENAISFHRESLELRPAPHPLRYSSLINLATALSARFKKYGQREDLNKAISFNQEALKLLPAQHPNRLSLLNNLATVLMGRFQQFGQKRDLESAISFYQKVVDAARAKHIDQFGVLGNLANAISTRFEQSGNPDDLDVSISLYRESLMLLPPSHSGRAACLNNLASMLVTRFEQSGRPVDLDTAISFDEEALKLRPALHPDRSVSLNSLANAWLTRFQQFRQPRDLEAAISSYHDALNLRPVPHPGRGTSLNNLATALVVRFEQSGRHEDLMAAISFNKEALKLEPGRCPDRAKCLNSLARALMGRFEQSGRHDDLKEAISFRQKALNSIIPDHPSICSYSTNLGSTFMKAYTHTNDSKYLHNAIDAFKSAVACRTAPASHRFRAARVWATHADSRHDSALDAYQAAIELLPHLAMLGLDLSSRQQALTSSTDGLAREAAACAIRSGEYERAVELLEEGRAVFWSQALQLRTPMADLHEVAPELAAELTRISLDLEKGSLRDVSQDMCVNTKTVMSMEREAARLRGLSDEWLATLEKVRKLKLKGFEDFLRPRRLSTLLGVAAKTPVAILNASKAGCAALILTSKSVQHVPLVLTFDDVTALEGLIQIATGAGHRDPAHYVSIRRHVDNLLQQVLLSTTPQSLQHGLESRDATRIGDGRGPDDDFRRVLAVLWKSVIIPVLQTLCLKKSEAPPNLWWCPTGPFTFLPIHAAGFYNAKKTDCISDYVVSSYTPTISMLLGDMLVADSFKMIVVIEPNTPKQSALRYTVDELQRIENHVPTKDLIKLESATVEEVISHLPTTTVAHFACHGQQHQEKPLESALILHDGPLKVSQIMQQPTPNAWLAYLGACQTAKGDKVLPDEAIHLASTVLFAGFRGVVATMWSISDVDGPKVADAFYEYLYREKQSSQTGTFRPDIREAARALHVAVAKLRSEGVSFKRWVPFIHMGR